MSTAIDIGALFAPKSTDVPYVCEDELIISFILRTDSYKFGHPFAYPKSKKRRVVGIAKDPITDAGKKSKEGVMTTVKWKMTGQLQAARLDLGLSDEFEDQHILQYHTGTLYNEVMLDTVRERSAV